MSLPIVLSYIQAQALLRARQAGESSVALSPDLGLSTVQVTLDAEGVCFPNDAPTMLVAGLPMHRIKETDPYADTLTKVRTIQPIVGRVLDTATGLGYTAIEAAKTAEEVVSIELDPAGIEIARLNPWSQPLFQRPNIRMLVGDAVDLVPTFEDAAFSRILHDPPMIIIAGDLYSATFYRELYRVLRRGGRLFHYVGDPDSPSGSRTTGGVIRRLQEVGFSRVVRRSEAFGVVAYK
jgi:predicted methyltransferase